MFGRIDKYIISMTAWNQVLLAVLLIFSLSSLGYAAGDARHAFLVVFDEPSLLDYHRDHYGSIGALDLRSANMRDHRAMLSGSRAGHSARIKEAIGRSPVVSHHYFILLSGLVIKLSEDEVKRISDLPGIRSVSPEQYFRRSTNDSPEFVGADQIWAGAAVPEGMAARGEGMVVAILDSGIPLEAHPSFDNDASCGHGTGSAPDKLISAVDCTWTDIDGNCVGETPEAVHPHGPWVASIAAGNRLVSGEAQPSPSSDIAGIAPCAHIRSYRVCGQSSCASWSVLSALENTLLDGDVSAVNYSISGGLMPWNTSPGANIELTMLELVDSGILIAAGAGNTSSGSTDTEGLVNNISPWVLSVASSGIFRPDELSHFSLRGPTGEPVINTQKPDIAAPGSAIYGATIDGYGIGSGTSASAPHVAGGALLLRQIHPDWTPMEIASAIRMTAHAEGWKDNGFVPWDWDDVGSGRLDLSRAALSGLVLHETRDNFLAANPEIGGDVRTLNLPAVRDMNCSPQCSWTRSFRNTLSTPSTWTVQVDSSTSGMVVDVEPQSLSFTGDLNETAELSITTTLQRDLRSHVSFASITLSEQSGLSPDLHLTLAIRGVGGPQMVPIPQSLMIPIIAETQVSIPLVISNADGSEPLHWEVIQSGSQSKSSSEAPIHPSLDETLSLSGFSLAADQTHSQSIVAGVASAGRVHGFTFEGSVSGVSGTFTRADDLRMEIASPEGETFRVGGDELGSARWEFGFPESDEDGTFTSRHQGRYIFGEFGTLDDGLWAFDFKNTFLHTMHWSDVTVTLHKEKTPCETVETAAWLVSDLQNGQVLPGTDMVLQLSINSDGLPLGIHSTELCFSSNAMDVPVLAVPVRINVVSSDSLFRDRFQNLADLADP